MTDRRKLLLLIPNLNGGGAERVALQLQRHLDPRRFHTVVGVLSEHGEYADTVTPDRYHLAGGRLLRSLAERCPQDSIRKGFFHLPLMTSLVRAHRPDIVMTLMADMAIPFAAARAIFPGLRANIRWVIREANNTRRVVTEAIPNRVLRHFINAAIKRTYRAADLVVTSSEGVARGLVTNYGLQRGKIAVVANPIDIDAVRAAASARPAINIPERFVVAAGRLTKQKGFDLLLRAFASSKWSSHHLVILGEGPQRANLEKLAAELSIGERLHLPGFVANPWSVFSRAELFCLSSRWEGFANVVIEAMVCGTPVLVAACPYGPGEIVRNGVNGVTVTANDWQALRMGIDRILDDRDAARMRAGVAREDMYVFEANRIADLYGNVLAGEAAGGRRDNIHD